MNSHFRLVVGLGNPGTAYARTRHNVGFMVADLLAERWGAGFSEETKWGAAIARSPRAILCKPLQFMNRSGGPVRAVADFFKISPGEILVLLDDSALPLGGLRLRERGSAGGHNGLDAILQAFGTDAIPRLRAGIGSARHGDLSDHVLGRFSEDEAPARELLVRRAADAVQRACEEGLTAAMNEFNKAGSTTP